MAHAPPTFATPPCARIQDNYSLYQNVTPPVLCGAVLLSHHFASAPPPLLMQPRHVKGSKRSLATSFVFIIKLAWPFML
jgi:hypothetical protein